MKKTAKKTTKKPSISKRKLAAYGLGIGGCGAMLAGSAEAVLVDVEIPFLPVVTPNETLNSATTNSFGDLVGASVGGLTWGSTDIGLNSIVFLGPGKVAGTSTEVEAGYFGRGFYNSDIFFGNGGMAVFEANNVSSTWGDNSHGGLPSSIKGKASFVNRYGTDVPSTQGVIGFLTSTDNWGYLEFDWVLSTKTLTVLSAKVETVVGDSATFSVSAVPEANPATLMALFSLGAVGLKMGRKRKAAAA